MKTSVNVDIITFIGVFCLLILIYIRTKKKITEREHNLCSRYGTINKSKNRKKSTLSILLATAALGGVFSVTTLNHYAQAGDPKAQNLVSDITQEDNGVDKGALLFDKANETKINFINKVNEVKQNVELEKEKQTKEKEKLAKEKADKEKAETEKKKEEAKKKEIERQKNEVATNYQQDFETYDINLTNTNASDKGKAVLEAAYAQLGRYQDCTMLVTNSLKSIGINFHDWPAGYTSLGKEVPLSEAQPGDILIYKDGGLGVGHVAIYAGNGKAIHGGWLGNQTSIGPAIIGSGITAIRL